MCMWASVFGSMQPRHSFDSNLTELDTILVCPPQLWLPLPSSRVVAVIAQKTECCIASVITQEGQPSLSSGLATLFVFYSERGVQRQPEVSSRRQVFFPLLSFLSATFLQLDRRLGDITIEKEPGRQPWSPGHSIPLAPVCLPVSLMFKSNLLYYIEP